MQVHEVLILGMLVSAFGNTAWSADPIRIVRDGQPRAAVVLPADAHGQTEAAARLLVEYVKQSSGAELPIVKGPMPQPAKQPVAIHVGRSPHVDRLHPELDQTDDDGFVIHGVDPSQVIIAGPTPYGTEFGVYEFLERYVGVRWLMPGPDGDDVPARASIEVPVGQVRQEPAIFSRLFSGLRGNTPVRQPVAELANTSESEHVRDQAGLMRAIVDGNITPISKNHSFEQGEGNLSADWSYWVKPDPVTKKGVGRTLRSADRAHDGERSLLCDAMYRGGPVNTIQPLKPGKYCAFAWVYVDLPERTECKGTCELVVTPRGADRQNLPGLSTKITPPRAKWTLIVAGGKIEKEINGKRVTHALMIPIVHGFRDGGGKVYWDEVAL